MPRLSEIWIETWEPAGVVRADRVVRFHLRRGGNVALPEPGPGAREVSFCADAGAGPLLLGCTDDVDGAAGQLAELVATVRRATLGPGTGPRYVFRSEPDDAPPWTVAGRLPGAAADPLVPAPRGGDRAARPPGRASADLAGR